MTQRSSTEADMTMPANAIEAERLTAEQVQDLLDQLPEEPDQVQAASALGRRRASLKRWEGTLDERRKRLEATDESRRRNEQWWQDTPSNGSDSEVWSALLAKARVDLCDRDLPKLREDVEEARGERDVARKRFDAAW